MAELIDALDALLDAPQKPEALRHKGYDAIDAIDAPSRVGAREEVQQFLARHPYARVYVPPSNASSASNVLNNNSLQQPSASSSASSASSGKYLRESIPQTAAWCEYLHAQHGGKLKRDIATQGGWGR